MQGTQLFNEGGDPILPQTDAKCVSSGIVTTNNTVWDDLYVLFSRYQTLNNQVSGATSVENNLGIIVEYSTNNCTNINDASLATYGENLIFPTAANPYLWLKTVYMWGDTVVKTTYTIAATALFPETQMMFAVGQIGDNVGVPVSYSDGAADSLNEDIKWYTYPPQDITNTMPCAFIATRSRSANETWQGKVWHSAKYGQYPITT